MTGDKIFAVLLGFVIAPGLMLVGAWACFEQEIAVALAVVAVAIVIHVIFPMSRYMKALDEVFL